MKPIEKQLEKCGIRGVKGDDMPYVFNTIILSGEDLKQANLSSQINGSNQNFTIPESIKSGSLRVYWNGLRQVSSNTYSELTSTTFSTTFTPVNGDFIVVEYSQQ